MRYISNYFSSRRKQLIIECNANNTSYLRALVTNQEKKLSGVFGGLRT
jgi:hypothetical protein